MCSLRLATPTTPASPSLSPEALRTHLAASRAAVDALARHLECSPEDLARTLASPHAADLLKARLATLHIQRLARQYRPLALATLLEIAHSKNPHLARRAATTLRKTLTR